MSNGLLNTIARSHGRDDRQAAATYVSTSFFLLLAIACTGGFVFLLAYRHIAWQRVFNLSNRVSQQEAAATVAVLFFCFLVHLPLTVTQRALFGYQKGFVNYAWEAVASLLGLSGIVCAIHFHLGLAALVFAVAAAPVLTAAMNSIVFFYRNRQLRPRLRLISRDATVELLGLGFLFLVIQVATATGYQTDYLIIARVLGTSSVAGYAVAAKLFVFVPALCSMVLTPLWPAYGEASARNDARWMSATLRYSLWTTGGVAAAAGVVLAILGRPLIRSWIGPAFVPSGALLAGLALWTVLSGVTQGMSTFLNGIGFVRVQAVCSLLMAAGNVWLSVLLTRRIGIAGAIYGTLLTQTGFILLPYCFYIPKLLASAKERELSIAAGVTGLRLPSSA